MTLNVAFVRLHEGGALLLALATIALILARPWQIPEWVWAIAGAFTAVVCGLISVPAALLSIGHGWNVYLFLGGILLFAEVARQHGVFSGLTGVALCAAGGSQFRLFTLFFVVGVVVTAFLSNDTTAIVLTIAVIYALAETNVSALPYVYACAFVANAASFVLPIANPANLLVFDGHIPLLGSWLGRFAIPSLAAIVLTYVTLLVLFRKSLSLHFITTDGTRTLSNAGRAASVMLALSVVALILTNVVGASIGITAILSGVLTVIVVTFFDTSTPLEALRHAAWGILPLVAGLFVIVGMLKGTVFLTSVHHGLQTLAAMPPDQAKLVTAAIVTAACNVFNNLPVALFAGSVLHAQSVPRSIADTILIAVDIGSNLSVTGSLATLLWLLIVRRANLPITPWHFFRLGLFVCLPALILATLCVR